MFKKVLVANRGAVASQVIRVLKSLGIQSVAIYSDADKDAPYLKEADTALRIGPPPAKESYLCVTSIIDAIHSSGADAVHPGYGFLSENAEFAQRIIDEGVAFIGPSPKWLLQMGHKTHARTFISSLGLPIGIGSDILTSDRESWFAAAQKIGYPLLVKPAGGGGGIGMVRADSDSELVSAVSKSQSLAARGFSNPEVYLERFIERPRHIELQILADKYNCATHLFERDCSVQRRHQKVLEEAPAPGISRERVEAVASQFVTALASAGYDNIGTVEMLLEPNGEFAFLEMNTRLQVEHGVTEEAYGVDIVEAQIRLAAGDRLANVLPTIPIVRQHAVEARVYAEDSKRFLPSPGPLTVFSPPSGPNIRVETGYREGMEVTPFYDPLLAKVIASGPTRQEAVDRLSEALREFSVSGIRTNIQALLRVLHNDRYRSGALHTGILQECIA